MSKSSKKVSPTYIYGNLAFKKKHLQFLSQIRANQERQRCQIKTVNAVYLRSSCPGYVQQRQHDALRRALSRKLNRLIRISSLRLPAYMVTAKPKEMRMGKGKGGYSYSQTNLRVGQPYLKVSWCRGHSSFIALWALRTASKKGPFYFWF